MHSNITARYIDRVTVMGNDIHIDGWSLQCRDTTQLTVVFPNHQTISIPEEHWRRSSPDIENIYGTQYSSVRFEIITPFPKDIAPKDIGLISLRFDDKEENHTPILTFGETWSHVASTPLHQLKIGIGIPTYNRSGTLPHVIEQVKKNTSLPFNLFVSNDGSNDTTCSILRDFSDISYGNFRNRGIAWNKNRILFYLKEILKCDVIIILEDDMFPDSFAWEIDWIFAALRLGHINLAHPHQHADEGGVGFWHDPVISYSLSGQCSAFAREALSYVGFLDPRFGRYGHEHVEHTLRFIRMGYGGRPRKNQTGDAFYLLRSNLLPIETPSHSDPQEVEKASKIFDDIKDDVAYRSPWLPEDLSIRQLRDDMALIKER
ncbi:glycosyltransferase family 2 protein [Saccharibacter floricola]|uniref:glycosyltransferase family 2 protein n=1 Tax=Saccharibacter floricola TaxID=231053 RepID=UPI0003A37BEB|nr:glycosyltransferase [Saccharibacter floricola]